MEILVGDLSKLYGYILLIACGILALLSGIGAEAAWQSVINILTDFSSLNTLLSVMMIQALYSNFIFNTFWFCVFDGIHVLNARKIFILL